MWSVWGRAPLKFLLFLCFAEPLTGPRGEVGFQGGRDISMAKETILVVEDEPLVGLEIREDLERLGYTVPDVVSSGDDVMQAVAKNHPALVIMDIKIDGGMDGIEAAYQIKAEFDNIPVVYLTAYSDASTLKRAAETGPDAFLLKPFDERELAANVAMALSRARVNIDGGGRFLDFAIPFVEALDQAALVVDMDERVSHANQKALELLKVYDSVRIEGELLSRFVLDTQQDDNPAMPSLRRVRAADGSLPAATVSIEPLTKSDGSRIGSLVTFDTMSQKERALLESSVEEINGTLARLLPGADAAGQGTAVGAFLAPCRSGSGDLVDVLRLSSSDVAFYGLDVMGHGTLASLIAYSLHGMVRELARSRSAGSFLSPSALIHELNDRYATGGEDKPFFTMAYGLLNSQTGEFKVARAGHPALVRINASGIPSYIGEAGTAVGVLDELNVSDTSGKLEPLEKIIIMSDGLLEAVAGTTDVGSAAKEFLEFAREHGKENAAEFTASVRRYVNRKATAPGLRDDASMLVLERTAS